MANPIQENVFEDVEYMEYIDTPNVEEHTVVLVANDIGQQLLSNGPEETDQLSCRSNDAAADDSNQPPTSAESSMSSLAHQPIIDFELNVPSYSNGQNVDLQFDFEGNHNTDASSTTSSQLCVHLYLSHTPPANSNPPIIIQVTNQNGHWNQNTCNNTGVMPASEDTDNNVIDYDSRLRCPICFRQLNEYRPRATSCGHIFCSPCISQALIDRQNCPVCGVAQNFSNTIRIYV